MSDIKRVWEGDEILSLMERCNLSESYPQEARDLANYLARCTRLMMEMDVLPDEARIVWEDDSCTVGDLRAALDEEDDT